MFRPTRVGIRILGFLLALIGFTALAELMREILRENKDCPSS